MFAYCGNNPVKHKDTEGTMAGIIIGGIIGAAIGALNAKKAGENVLFGALVGGLAGIASGTLGVIAAGCGQAAMAVCVIGNGLISVGSKFFNKYINYRLQDKAKRENSQNGIVTTSGSTASGQRQDVANNAYNASSFEDFYNPGIEDVAKTFGRGAVGGYVGRKVSQWNTQPGIGIPAGEIPNIAMDTATSFGLSMIEILFDTD